MTKIKLGAEYRFTPSAFVGELDSAGERKKREVVGHIIYIHPARRFFTVEAAIHSHTIRESFLIIDREAENHENNRDCKP